MNYMGIYYEEGKGIYRDYAQAVGWYHKAASKGNEYAMYNLGRCYDNGRGVTKNLKQANQWYRKAAEKGHAGAMKKLYENMGVRI